MDFTRNLEELEELGYTLLPRFIDKETTADIRRFIDDSIANKRYSGAERGSSTFHYRVCSPIEHPIAAQLASDRRILEVAAKSLRAEHLRLRQQMFMLTNPCGALPPSKADGWHIDTPFTTAEWRATPSKVFIQFFYYCSPVKSGGAATMVVPRSHKLTYPAADAILGTDDGYNTFWRNTAELAQIDLSQAQEVIVDEGDVLIFNPMTLHTGSNNVTDAPRYAFHCSFYDQSSEKVRSLPRPTFYDIFSESMIAQMPLDLLPLLER